MDRKGKKEIPKYLKYSAGTKDFAVKDSDKKCPILLLLLFKLSHDSLGMTRAIATGEAGYSYTRIISLLTNK